MVSKEEFKREVWAIAEEIHARPKQIRLRDMKSKFGSCSSGRVITFNSSILQYDDTIRKEAIVHELLHIRYRNHGKLFKTVVKEYVKVV